MNIEIDQIDIETIDVKKPNNIIFNIIKYSVAISPIVLPFSAAMYFTNYNIILSILVTGAFDIALIICLTTYVLYSGKMQTEIEKKQVEQFTKVYETTEKIREKLE